jgi:hypothetical protein
MAFGVVLVRGAQLVARRRLLVAVLLLATALLGLSLSCACFASRNPDHWSACSDLSGRDGQSYCLLERSDLWRDVPTALGRVERDWLVWREVVILGVAASVPPIWTPIIRPAGVAHDTSSQLYLSPSGEVLIGLSDANHCNLVYDLKTKRFFGQRDIEGISPFVLLGEDTALHAPDVATFTSCWGDGCPGEDVLRPALEHRNPAVRELAAELLARRARRPADSAPAADDSE